MKLRNLFDFVLGLCECDLQQAEIKVRLIWRDVDGKITHEAIAPLGYPMLSRAMLTVEMSEATQKVPSI